MPPERARPARRRTELWVVAAVVVLACASRIPSLFAPVSPDEGGFLMVGSQWTRGTSLYGNYWVDRPPLLIAIHALAVDLGGALALRLIGMVAVAASALLAWALGRAAVAGRGLRHSTLVSVAPAIVVAIFMSTPLFGATRVDGELLSAPFVLAGIVALLQAFRAHRARTITGWAFASGAAAVAAALVKQNAVDVAFFAAAMAVLGLRHTPRRTTTMLAPFAAGAITTLTAVLAWAWSKGTTPLELWDAVVTFRFQAAAVISASATSATSSRMSGLLDAFAVSLAPVVLVALAWFVRRAGASLPRTSDAVPRQVPDLRWPAVTLLVWETVSIAMGGSYWLHYLLVLVPGLAVLTAAALQRPVPKRPFLAVLATALVSAIVSVAVAPSITPVFASDAVVARYLRDHGAPGDTMVVAFGHPNIDWDAKMSSPYSELWSLPVRVRDSKLQELDAVFRSPQAPRWVVVSGPSLATWGVDAQAADATLRSAYHPVTSINPYVIWERNATS